MKSYIDRSERTSASYTAAVALTFTLVVALHLSLFAQNDLTQLSQQNAQEEIIRTIEAGEGGALAGITVEGGPVTMSAMSFHSITYSSHIGYYEKKYLNGYFLAFHLVGYIAASDNFSIKTGIGIQFRNIVSQNFWSPGVYLKADIGVFRRILYITPGIDFIINDVQAASDEFFQDYGKMAFGDIIPKIGIGCNLGVVRFELVYKHGLYSLSNGVVAGNYPSKLGKSEYFGFGCFIMWK